MGDPDEYPSVHRDNLSTAVSRVVVDKGFLRHSRVEHGSVHTWFYQKAVSSEYSISPCPEEIPLQPWNVAPYSHSILEDSATDILEGHSLCLWEKRGLWVSMTKSNQSLLGGHT